MQQAILELIGGWLGQPAQAIGEAITEKKTEDGKEVITFKSADQIKSYLSPLFQEKVRSVRKSGHDEGHGRGKREALESVEKEIAEKYGLKKDSISTMFEELSKKHAKTIEVTPGVIRQSPVYIADMKAKAAEALAAKEELDKFKGEVEAGEMKRKGQQLLDPLFDGFQLYDAEKFAKQHEVQKSLVKDAFFQQYKLEYVKGSAEPKIIDLSTGKEALDANFNPITIKDAFVSVASTQLPPAAPKTPETPGGQTTQTPGGTTGKFPEIKTHNDFYAKINSVDPKEQEAFKEHYKQLVKDGKIV